MRKFLSALLFCSSFAMGASSSADVVVEKLFNPLVRDLHHFKLPFVEKYPVICEKLKEGLSEIDPAAIEAILSFISSERWQAYVACQRQFALSDWDDLYLQSLLDSNGDGDEKLPKNIIYDNVNVNKNMNWVIEDFAEERIQSVAESEYALFIEEKKAEIARHFSEPSEGLLSDLDALCKKHMPYDEAAVDEIVQYFLPYAKRAIKYAVYNEFKAQFGDVLRAQDAFYKQWAESIDLLNQLIQQSQFELSKFVMDNFERMNAEQKKIDDEKYAKEADEARIKWQAQCNGQTVEEYLAMIAKIEADRAEAEAVEAAKTPEQRAQEEAERRLLEEGRHIEFLIREKKFEQKRFEEKQAALENQIKMKLTELLARPK